MLLLLWISPIPITILTSISQGWVLGQVAQYKQQGQAFTKDNLEFTLRVSLYRTWNHYERGSWIIRKKISTFLIPNSESKLIISLLSSINSVVLKFSISTILFGLLLFALLHLLCGLDLNSSLVKYSWEVGCYYIELQFATLVLYVL